MTPTEAPAGPAAATATPGGDANRMGSTLVFREGLFGFPECRQFTLQPTNRSGFYWLQSVEHASLAFVLADPFLFFDNYSIELADGDIRDLAARDASDIAVLTTVTLPDAPDQLPTTNLQGPIIINLHTRRGRQTIVNDPAFGVRHTIDLQRAAAAA